MPIKSDRDRIYCYKVVKKCFETVCVRELISNLRLGILAVLFAYMYIGLRHRPPVV